MKKVVISSILFILFTLVVFLKVSSLDVLAQGYTGPSSELGTASERWEYTILMISDPYDHQSNLAKANSLGNEGWELVAMTSPHQTFWFKRRLP